MMSLPKQNMGVLDRGIRLFLGIVLGVLSAVTAKGLLATAMMVFSVLLIAAGIYGFCLLYIPLGISTTRERRGQL